jgi:AmmeMemoRadiSam system protein A
MFTDDERHTLLRIARHAIGHGLGLIREEPVLPVRGALGEPAAAFVTLHLDGELRGCIGYVEALEPLAATVSEVAVRAAFHDPRFPPLTEGEFGKVVIEVSVLSPLQLLRSEEEIEIGRDGLVLELHRARGLLLPQVATEQGWDRIRFLEFTAMKAGLPPSAWKDPEAHVYTFSAEVFAESSMEGAHP